MNTITKILVLLLLLATFFYVARIEEKTPAFWQEIFYNNMKAWKDKPTTLTKFLMMELLEVIPGIVEIFSEAIARL